MNIYQIRRDVETAFKDRSAKQFTKHVVEFEQIKEGSGNQFPMQQLIWKNPEDGFYRINFVLAHGLIHVSGDLGVGSFQNGYRSVWDLVHDDYHYLASKLVGLDGSPRDRGNQFRSDLCRRQMEHWLQDEDTPEHSRKVIEGWQDAHHSEDEWTEFVYNSADVEAVGDLLEFGQMLNPRMISWFVGIDMAYNQLHGSKEGEQK